MYFTRCICLYLKGKFSSHIYPNLKPETEERMSILVAFLLFIVLSLHPRFTDSDYPFGIFNSSYSDIYSVLFPK